ncbi:MAG: ZIP family metal transporter [Defluviitaleaceae bacterium]|nr:ZIP family metal transporter [Defluviitaleaceae bacterium]
MENISGLTYVLILATAAGFVTSILGGILGMCVSRPSKKFIGLSFIFVASVLITLVFVDFIPDAIGHGHYHTRVDPATGQMYQYWYQHNGAGIWLTIIGVLIGAGLILALSFFDKHGHEHIHGILPHSEHCSHTDEAGGLTGQERRRIIAGAVPMILAIVIHDFPKGLAIGNSGSILAALAIGLACIPEGMSVAIPLKAGGMTPLKILGVCGLAGLSTTFGALIGYLVGGINVYVSGLMIAVAAGCLLGVVFSEIMPLAIEYSGRTRWKLPIMVAGVVPVFAFNHFFHGLMH